VAGQWIGTGASQLGLAGKVRADDFLRLCENQHPATGETLTQRLNTLRMDDGKETVNRRVFYDFTFSPPKSVSVVALAGADGERLHLKANRNLDAGARTTNGELVTVKTVRPDGGIELDDGWILGKNFREFLLGYAVTSYGSQGKTVDHVLFSDSTIKAATNAQQWYVTISRGRRGIRIFTPDKIQLRENLVRSGHRPLAMELGHGLSPRHANRRWERLHGYLLRFGHRAADTFCRLKKSRPTNTN
jgi:hypothetical protein